MPCHGSTNDAQCCELAAFAPIFQILVAGRPPKYEKSGQTRTSKSKRQWTKRLIFFHDAVVCTGSCRSCMHYTHPALIHSLTEKSLQHSVEQINLCFLTGAAAKAAGTAVMATEKNP